MYSLSVNDIFVSVSALFFNNCMYLAHELATLGIQFSNLLQENIITTFVDFIDPLRSLGYSILNSQIDIQRQQLLEILSLSGKYEFVVLF